MNQLIDIGSLEPDAKRRFTVDEFERMGMAGIFGTDERVELLAGEIFVMSPAGRFHEVLRTELSLKWSRRSSADVKVVSEMQLRLSASFQPVADIVIFEAYLLAPDVRGPTALLVVEIADSSLNMDTTLKAAAYAAGGVRDYWVINARTRETIIFRDPGPEGFATKFGLAATDTLTPLLVPELAIGLTELPEA